MSTIAPQSTHAPGRDPLEAVLALGWEASRVGLLIGALIAFFGHSLALAKPVFSLTDMFEGVQEMREELSDYYWTTYEIDVSGPEKLPEPEKAEPEAPPEPDLAEPDPVVPDPPDPLEPPPPAAPDDPPPSDDPYEEPPPAAGEAADVLNAEPDAVDMSGDGWEIVDKDGSQSNGAGRTSQQGTADKPVYDPRASSTGRPGATGTATVRRRPPPRPAKNLSRQAMPTNMGVLRACPFPAQADVAQIDRATVVVTVTVSSAGRALRASASGGPGYGFGPQARACAMSASYRPALDSGGKATTAAVSLRFRFTR